MCNDMNVNLGVAANNYSYYQTPELLGLNISSLVTNTMCSNSTVISNFCALHKTY